MSKFLVAAQSAMLETQKAALRFLHENPGWQTMPKLRQIVTLPDFDEIRDLLPSIDKGLVNYDSTLNAVSLTDLGQKMVDCLPPPQPTDPMGAFANPEPGSVVASATSAPVATGPEKKRRAKTKAEAAPKPKAAKPKKARKAKAESKAENDASV